MTFQIRNAHKKNYNIIGQDQSHSLNCKRDVQVDNSHGKINIRAGVIKDLKLKSINRADPDPERLNSEMAVKDLPALGKFLLGEGADDTPGWLQVRFCRELSQTL